MTLETFHFEHTAAANVYIRIFDSIGQVFDFADNVFKKLSTTHAITAVTTGVAGASSFGVETDITSSLVVGQKFRVSGSTGNDAVYTIRSDSSFAAGTTTINVEEAVSDATVDGTIDLTATPYKTAVERVDMAGTGRSGYTVAVDLANLNATINAIDYLLKFYDNVAPASADNPISDGGAITVQYSELGEFEVLVQSEISVTSTAGSIAHVLLWLMWKGQKVVLNAADTCSITLTEVGAGVVTFTLTEADKIGANAIVNNAFELQKNTPGFPDDRQFVISASITTAGKTFTSPEAMVVIG